MVFRSYSATLIVRSIVGSIVGSLDSGIAHEVDSEIDRVRSIVRLIDGEVDRMGSIVKSHRDAALSPRVVGNSRAHLQHRHQHNHRSSHQLVIPPTHPQPPYHRKGGRIGKYTFPSRLGIHSMAQASHDLSMVVFRAASARALALRLAQLTSNTSHLDCYNQRPKRHR